VLASVAFQGGWPLWRRAWRRGPRAAPASAAPELSIALASSATPELSLPMASSAAPEPGAPHASVAVPDRMNLEQMRLHQSRGEPVVVIDVRTTRSYQSSEQMAAGALRVPPERAVVALRGHGVPANAWVVAYCT
jgi:sodium/hydrogen antiporter